MILFVEDDDDHAEIALRSLRDHRLRNLVHRAADGAAALDYLFRRGRYENPENSPRPHMVLLDLRIPKIDGLEVLRAIKTDDELRRIPVVVLMTSENQSDVTRAYDLHANAYIVKPVDFTKFFQLMRDLGLFWLVWNKAPLDDTDN